jgi:hypothetical protein
LSFEDALYKIHKPGISVRPIIDNTNYYASQMSTFLHCQLGQKVFQNPFVLKDSLTLIRQLKEVQVSGFQLITISVTQPLTGQHFTLPLIWNEA